MVPVAGRSEEPGQASPGLAAGLPDRAASVVPVAGRSEEPGQASPGPPAGLPGRAAPATATTGTTDEPDPSLTRASGDTQPTGPGTAVTGVGKPAAAGSAWLPVPLPGGQHA